MKHQSFIEFEPKFIDKLSSGGERSSFRGLPSDQRDYFLAENGSGVDSYRKYLDETAGIARTNWLLPKVSLFLEKRKSAIARAQHVLETVEDKLNENEEKIPQDLKTTLRSKTTDLQSEISGGRSNPDLIEELINEITVLEAELDNQLSGETARIQNKLISVKTDAGIQVWIIENLLKESGAIITDKELMVSVQAKLKALKTTMKGSDPVVIETATKELIVEIEKLQFHINSEKQLNEANKNAVATKERVLSLITRHESALSIVEKNETAEKVTAVDTAITNRNLDDVQTAAADLAGQISVIEDVAGGAQTIYLEKKSKWNQSALQKAMTKELYVMIKTTEKPGMKIGEEFEKHFQREMSEKIAGVHVFIKNVDDQALVIDTSLRRVFAKILMEDISADILSNQKVNTFSSVLSEDYEEFLSLPKGSFEEKIIDTAASEIASAYGIPVDDVKPELANDYKDAKEKFKNTLFQKKQ